MNVTKKYLYFYSPQDYEKMLPAKEDVFYENKGKIYTQFREGDLLPTMVWEELFGSSKSAEFVERNVPQVSQSELEGKSLSMKEIQSDNDENYAEKVPKVKAESPDRVYAEKVVKEVRDIKTKEVKKARKKRAKSIIKKS